MENPKVQIKSHRDLIVWQKAVELDIYLYKLTKFFPKMDEVGRMLDGLLRSLQNI